MTSQQFILYNDNWSFGRIVDCTTAVAGIVLLLENISNTIYILPVRSRFQCALLPFWVE
jgi:hypothetical protein